MRVFLLYSVLGQNPFKNKALADIFDLSASFFIEKAVFLKQHDYGAIIRRNIKILNLATNVLDGENMYNSIIDGVINFHGHALICYQKVASMRVLDA